MQNLTEKIDELFAQNKGQEAQALMQDCLKEALQNGNLEDAVPILNELIGYCRETSQVQRSYDYADLVLRIMNEMGLQGSIPYATTLLNIANALYSFVKWKYFLFIRFIINPITMNTTDNRITL